MRFALKITSESLDCCMGWNGGVRPDDEVIDTDHYLITDTHPTYLNELFSGDFFRANFRFVGEELPGEWSQVIDSQNN